jgi:hypothetical protein
LPPLSLIFSHAVDLIGHIEEKADICPCNSECPLFFPLLKLKTQQWMPRRRWPGTRDEDPLGTHHSHFSSAIPIFGMPCPSREFRFTPCP